MIISPFYTEMMPRLSIEGLAESKNRVGIAYTLRKYISEFHSIVTKCLHFKTLSIMPEIMIMVQVEWRNEVV